MIFNKEYECNETDFIKFFLKNLILLIDNLEEVSDYKIKALYLNPNRKKYTKFSDEDLFYSYDEETGEFTVYNLE